MEEGFLDQEAESAESAGEAGELFLNPIVWYNI